MAGKNMIVFFQSYVTINTDYAALTIRSGMVNIIIVENGEERYGK